ncbi:MAG: UvrD-helicase domain-containing protein [Myxococcales bacterium]|nr:UvrD-helicase domain-containing protein [Myxococcales bacterium]
MTFTRKAAGELRLRLRQALIHAHAESAGDARRALAEALLRLDEATVGTIHSFCADILRRHPVEANVDPGFEELDEDTAAPLLERAFSDWFRDELGRRDSEVWHLVLRSAVDRDPPKVQLFRALQTVVETRDLLLGWEPKPRPTPDEARKLLDRVLQVSFELADPFPKATRQAEAMRFFELADLAGTYRARIEGEGIDAARLEADLASLPKRLKRRPLTGPWNDKHKGPSAQKLWNDLLGELWEFRGLSDDSLAPAVRERLNAAVARYERLKRKAGCLDFTDLLSSVRSLLERRPDVRVEEAKRLDLIAVDELQDLEPSQAEILLLLSSTSEERHTWRDVRPECRKAVLVETAQAIYGFRRGRPPLSSERLRAHLCDRGVERLDLTVSHRAVADLQAMIREVLVPELHSQDDELPQSRGQAPLTGGPPSIAGQPAVVVIAEDLERPTDDPTSGGPEAQKRGNLLATAGFIDWLIRRSGFRVRDGDAIRPVAARDIAVLFRKMTFTSGTDLVKVLADELEGRNLPFTQVGKMSIGGRDDVEALRAVLRAIEWPDEELFVYAALAGPIFAHPDHVLDRYRRMVGRLSPLAREERPNDEAFAEVHASLAVLEDVSRQKSHLSVAAVIGKLFEATRAPSAFAQERSGSESVAQLDNILDLAIRLERQRGASLRSFIAFLDRAGEKREVERPSDEHAEGIRIMTVHNAKGLEFPVVVLADPSQPWASGNRLLDLEKGAAYFKLAGMLPSELRAREEEAKEREAEEEARIAYVAATRARDLLVIPVPDVASSRAPWFGDFLETLRPRRGDEHDRSAWGTDEREPSSQSRGNNRTVEAGEYRRGLAPVHLALGGARPRARAEC